MGNDNCCQELNASSCGCGHEHHHATNKWSKIELLVGAILFIISEFTDLISSDLKIYVLIIAYILLGGKVVLTALKNLVRGKIFDENFLMTVATLGAFGIKRYDEAVGVMLFYRIGVFFEEHAVEKSRKQIMSAIDLRPEVVNLIENQDIKIIPANAAQIDDLLLVRVGDRIPLDGKVVEGTSYLDTSAITGESVPIRCDIGDSVISGSVNTSGMLKIRVEKILAESMVSKILAAVEDAAAKKPKVERLITRFAKIYTPIVVIMAVLLATIPSFITGDWQRWIYTALTFLVISCPCALVLSVPLSYFAGIGVASKQGILFKSGNLMETLKDIKMVVLDKTGTVTKGNFVVQKIYGKDIQNILKVCASVEQVSAHPLAKSIVTKAQMQGIKLLAPTNFTEYAGEGIQAMLESEEVLCGNEKLLQRFNVEMKEDKVATYTIVYIAINRIYQGYITIADTLKEDAISAIGLLHKQNLKVAMLTGDNIETANNIVEKTGIDFVKAKLLPQEKLQELTKLRDTYGKVMYVGDGINDAPVLAGADVSAAMGSGTDAAIEAADLVIMNSDMLSIPKARRIAQATLTIVWQNIIMALGIKIIIMFLGVAGYASMWAAVFADTGVLALCVLNAVRLLYKKF